MQLIVKVSQKTQKGVSGFTGTVSLPGLKTTQIESTDGRTWFASRSALFTVARNAAKQLKTQPVFVEKVKVAAKKATTKKN